MSIGLEVKGFSIGNYETRKNAEAYISGRSQVSVKIPENAHTEQVNYAFAIRVRPDENASLYNGNNLPCPAFSIKVNQ